MQPTPPASAAPPSTPYLDRLLDYVRAQHPRSLPGIEEARAAAPRRFPAMAEMFLEWLVAIRGEEGIPAAVDAFVQFTTDVNMAQARYEAEGEYANKSFADVYAHVYSQTEAMTDYLWGVYLTNFLWAHHTELSIFFEDYFLPRLSGAPELVEIAPGHGQWGVWALKALPEARLRGFDISDASLEIANAVSRAAGVDGRAAYEIRDALDLKQVPATSADGVICCFLLEHLEDPNQLFAVVQHLLKPKGMAFLIGGLTAAHTDHIYEYRRESELILQSEAHGLRVVGSLSLGPKRTLRKAQFLPRSMAMVVQKRTNDIF